MARFIRVNQKSTKKPACWIFRYNFAELFREIKKSIWPPGLNCGRVLVTLSKQIILLAKKLFYKHEEINNFLKAEDPCSIYVVSYVVCCSSNNIIIFIQELIFFALFYKLKIHVPLMHGVSYFIIMMFDWIILLVSSKNYKYNKSVWRISLYIYSFSFEFLWTKSSKLNIVEQWPPQLAPPTQNLTNNAPG